MQNTGIVFKPEKRENKGQIDFCFNLLRNTGLLKRISDSIPCIVIILNHQRQIIFFNKNLTQSLDNSDYDMILGRRIGEVFNCIHSTETEDGCGSTVFCKECGADKAITEIDNLSEESCYECRINTIDNNSYDFKVWVTPYYFAKGRYTFVSLEDISDQKRKEVLERTFFHDINNLLMLITSYSELLNDPDDSEFRPVYSKTIHNASLRLSEEISAHKKLLLAEKGKLDITISELHSLVLLRQITSLYNSDDINNGVRIRISEDSQNFSIFTEKSLLQRVLINMTKNAIEASSRGDSVTIKCTIDGDNAVFTVHNETFISPVNQLQIFKRSFSTKGKGRGIGTYSIKLFGEKYLDGEVKFDSSKENGTTFYITIPLMHKKAALLL